MTDCALWERLQQDWRSAASDIDAARLHKHALRKRSRMLIMQIVEATATVGFTLYLLVAGLPFSLPKDVSLVYPLLVIIWLEFAMRTVVRLNTWKPHDVAADDLLRLAVRRAKAGLVFAWLGFIALIATGAIFAPALWLMWTGESAVMQAAARGGAVGYGICALIVLGWAILYGRRQCHEIRNATRLLSEIGDE